MTDVQDVRIAIELTYHEARAVRSALNARAKKFERAAAKGGFEPEEGKVDLNRLGAESHRRLADRIDDLLTEAIAAHKQD